jgi:anaerobic magnesium-protoporphyrin IX monomethyl ester cyclase
MKVLLLSMPDSFEHMPAIVVRMPNGALASLAGNVDPHHKVAIADLVLVQSRVRATVEQLLRELQPDVVGLSVMTFQRATAFRIARLIKALLPATRIVAGGYDPSLAPDTYEPCADIDFLIRGEGEQPFCELLRVLENDGDVEALAGVSCRTERGGFLHVPMRPVYRLTSNPLRLPNRAARVLSGYTLLGRQVDVVETSRGCTFDCSFCSIIEMRGRNFHPYPIDRVLADITDAQRRGARAIFLVDDNITLDVRRFESLCQAIIDNGLNTIDYAVQAMTSPIAQHGATLAPLMRKAGFRYVFLGIENVLDQDLEFLKAQAKNARRANGRTIGNATIEAIQHLHHAGMFVVGGLIVGNPGDTRESIEANLDFAKRYVDWPYIQHPTPYPRTPMAQQFRDEHLIVDEDPSHYDGTTAVVRSRHLPAREIEFLRWKAERWMKLRHLPAAFLHSPVFSLRAGARMMRHTFAGTNFRSMLGLDTQRAVFDRYREARRAERDAVGLAADGAYDTAGGGGWDGRYFAAGGAAGPGGLVSSMRQDGPPT